MGNELAGTATVIVGIGRRGETRRRCPLTQLRLSSLRSLRLRTLSREGRGISLRAAARRRVGAFLRRGDAAARRGVTLAKARTVG